MNESTVLLEMSKRFYGDDAVKALQNAVKKRYPDLSNQDLFADWMSDRLLKGLQNTFDDWKVNNKN